MKKKEGLVGCTNELNNKVDLLVDMFELETWKRKEAEAAIRLVGIGKGNILPPFLSWEYLLLSMCSTFLQRVIKSRVQSVFSQFIRFFVQNVKTQSNDVKF